MSDLVVRSTDLRLAWAALMGAVNTAEDLPVGVDNATRMGLAGGAVSIAVSDFNRAWIAGIHQLVRGGHALADWLMAAADAFEQIEREAAQRAEGQG